MKIRAGRVIGGRVVFHGGNDEAKFQAAPLISASKLSYSYNSVSMAEAAAAGGWGVRASTVDRKLRLTLRTGCRWYQAEMHLWSRQRFLHCRHKTARNIDPMMHLIFEQRCVQR